MRWKTLTLPYLVSISVTYAFSTGQLALIDREQIDRLPFGWAYDSRATDNEPIVLKVFINNYNADYIRIAEDVSDPTSPKSGMHLTAEEPVLARCNTTSSSEAVAVWLRGHVSPNVMP